jgi:ABC-2 type transport system permease protein
MVATDQLVPGATSEPAAGAAPWRVVAGRELRDLWLGGRGLPLMLAFSVLLSVTSYLVATNQELNFLEQRESVALTLQVAVAVGGLLALLGAADAVSGERERGTLESLLLTPVSRRVLVAGKGVAAMSLWVGAYVVAAPYVWYLARGVDVAGTALVTGLLVGTLLALFLVGFGLLVSIVAQSNRMSLSVTLFALLALFAPTQMPSSARNGWFGELLLRVDPFTAGLRVLGKVVIDGHTLGQEADWLVGPAVAAALACGAAYVVAGRLRLGAGDPT